MTNIETETGEQIISRAFQNLVTLRTQTHPIRIGEKMSYAELKGLTATDDEKRLIETVGNVSPAELAEIILYNPPKVFINASNTPDEVILREIDPGQFTFHLPSREDTETADLEIQVPTGLTSQSVLFEANVNLLRKYLQTRTITDNFGEAHNELRNPWESSIANVLALIDKEKNTKDTGKYYDLAFKMGLHNNRLKGSQQTKVDMALSSLSDMAAKEPGLEQLRKDTESAFTSLRAVQHKIPTTEKRADLIALIARRTLKKLHKNPIINEAQD